MGQLIAKRYANAIFELALEDNAVDEYNEQLKSIYDAINNDDDLLKVINHPQIKKEEKLKLFETCFKDNIADSVLGLINVIFNKNRQNELLDILSTFLKQVEEFKGIVHAEVYSAVELTDEQVVSIKTKLSQNLNKQVELDLKQDPSLIAGLKIKICGQIIDGSVKKQISDMKNTLLKTQIV